MVQNDNATCATFFVCAADQSAAWYGGTMYRLPGGRFGGALYAATGPWFGAPTFGPAQVAIVPGGTLTFDPTHPRRDRPSYTANNVPVSKTIDRQTPVNVPVAGEYLGAIDGEVTGCTNSSRNRTFIRTTQFCVTQSGSPGNVRIDFESTFDFSLVCRIDGPAEQPGKVLAIPTGA